MAVVDLDHLPPAPPQRRPSLARTLSLAASVSVLLWAAIILVSLRLL